MIFLMAVGAAAIADDSAPVLIDETDTEQTYESNGYSMTFSRSSGQLVLWRAPSGAAILDAADGESPPADAPLAAEDAVSTNEMPLRLYLLRQIAPSPDGASYNFVTNPFLVCGIDEYHFGYTHTQNPTPTALEHTWTVYSM
jgi:hypothetical protein